MPKPIPLEPDHFYHIYNRANGRDNLFHAAADYEHFLKLSEKFIDPIANIYAWVLMKNHFHFLVKIKATRYYRYSKKDFISSQPNVDGSPSAMALADAVEFENFKWQTTNNPYGDAKTSGSAIQTKSPHSGNQNPPQRKKANPTQHFGHLFNSYSRYFNTKYHRSGSLLQRPFQRIKMSSKSYLRKLVIYIHQNPVRHGFVDNILEYPWSSYSALINPATHYPEKEELLHWFGGPNKFEEQHQN